MKSYQTNPTLLAVGIAAVLGISTTATAQTVNPDGSTTGTAAIDNVAQATYNVDGIAQTAVQSNKVTINISETGQFSLTAQNADDNGAGDSSNTLLEVIPEGTVTFNHQLANLGNLSDTYTLSLTNDADDTADFDLANTTVTVTIFDDSGNPVGSPLVQTVSEFNSSPIVLAAGQTADISIDAVTTGNVGGDTQDLTLTATSQYLTDQGLDATATNADESLTTLPVFNIVKSVADTLNLNNSNDTATYSIVVTNDDSSGYAADATDITITDDLPQGLILVPGSVTSTLPGTLTETTTGAAAGTVVDGFTYSGIDLDAGSSVTITFEVQKDPNAALGAETINHASVSDDIDDDPNTDNTVVDSTDNTDPNENTDQFYPNDGDNSTTDGSDPTTPGGDSTEPLTATQRGLELSEATTQEIPTTTTSNTQATHQTVITNTGADVEADIPGEVTFTITDGDDTNNVTPITDPINIIYDVDGDPATTADQTTVTLSPDGNGVYDLNEALGTGMAPGSTATIEYNVAATEANNGDTETTTVTLIPGGVDAPTTGNFVVEDTTDVKGLELLKQQALDADCDGTADAAFTDGVINNVTPGQCVIYQIEATNGLTDFDITDLVLSDELANFSANAAVFENPTGTVGTLIAGTNSTIADDTVRQGPVNGNDAVYGTVDTLTAQETATLTFMIKVNETR